MEKLKTFIAVFLFKIGFPHRTAIFINGTTLKYGYGKLHGLGYFEYNLPAKYVMKNQ